MPTALPDKARRSRITAACAVCRAKRQKCSGSKPTCDQCQQNNEQCWWSDQKKRGPAKDYLRSLQDRLQETERLLLGVLDQISDDQLHAVLHTEAPAPSHHTWTTLSGQEYWARLPLTELASVREWQKERRTTLPRPRPAPLEPAVSLGHSADFAEPPTALDPMLSSSVTNVPHSNKARAPLLSADTTQDQAHHPPHREPPRRISLTRRYSDETRDVAKTLFSISHNGENLKRQREDNEYESYSEQNLSTHGSKTPEAPPSKFPKHLFW